MLPSAEACPRKIGTLTIFDRDSNFNDLIDDPGAPGVATYRYDGLNRRVMKVTHDDPNTTGQYMYYNENWQIVEVRRGVNQTPTEAAYKQFVYDIRYIDSPVCRWWDKDSDGTMEPTAGEMQYFTNDGNFNTTALIDANSGGVVERYLYDPYGRVTVLNGAAGAEKDPNVAEWSPDADNKSDWDNDVLFCGYWYDPETGLYHVRERYYDPVTGTWKTRDRILYPDGMSLYEYVRGNPVRNVDYTGKWGEEVHRKNTTRLADHAAYLLGDSPTAASTIDVSRLVGDFANSPDVWNDPPKAGLGLPVAVVLRRPIAEVEEAAEQVVLAAYWHFPGALETGEVKADSSYARAEITKGIKACNLQTFATGLHQLQDSWSHKGVPGESSWLEDTFPVLKGKYPYKGLIGHSKDRGGYESTTADDPSKWPKDAQDTLIATYKALREFRSACPCIKEGPHSGKWFAQTPGPMTQEAVEGRIKLVYPVTKDEAEESCKVYRGIVKGAMNAPRPTYPTGAFRDPPEPTIPTWEQIRGSRL